MAQNGFIVKNKISLKQSTTAGDTAGDIRYDGSGNLKLRDGAGEKTVLDEDNSVTVINKTIDADNNTISNLAHGAEVDNPSSGVHGVTGFVVGTSDTQTLTNKTFDADLNTVSNIDNADIKAGAAIDASKIADGSVSSTEFQYLSGVTSDIQTQLNATASATALTDHLNDTVDAHDASTISSVPAGNLAATTVQAALDELQSDVDTRALDSDLDTHVNAASGVHGITGSVVGTTDTQNVSNKTFTSTTLTSPVINTGVSGTAILDEDNMASNSATQLATQQSIKAYVDNSISAGQDIAVTSITNASSPYTALSSDYLILCNAASGAITVNLPTAVGITGKQYIIKKVDTTDTNSVTIDANLTETVDGSATTVLHTEKETVKIVSDGTNWVIVERRIPAITKSFTMSITGSGSNPTKASDAVVDKATYTRDGRHLIIHYMYRNDGAPSGAAAGSGFYIFGIPNSWTIDNTAIEVTNSGAISYAGGASGYIGTGTDNTMGFAAINSSTGVVVHFEDTSAPQGPRLIGGSYFPLTQASLYITFTVKVPITGWNG